MQFGLALEVRDEGDDEPDTPTISSSPSGQLLKWIGNKQRFAASIISFFPRRYRTYFEPFLGSGAVLGTLAPCRAEGSDIFGPLVGIWRELRTNPDEVKNWYRERYRLVDRLGKKQAYDAVKASYNNCANSADLLYLSRTCYGGVVRFRLRDGYMSTPCGIHNAMSPEKFAARVDDWHRRVAGTDFYHRPFEEAIERAGEGDIVYCDPPYTHSQNILYGAQEFSLSAMFRSIEYAKRRGAFVAVSIDGTKKSGNRLCDIAIPKGLFAREEMLNVGRSMLRRFQMGGQSLEAEVVRDRLLLTH